MGIPTGGGFADTKEVSFDPIPAGEYLCEVVEVEEKESGDKAKYPGAPYLNFELRIVEEGEWNDKPLWTIMSFATVDSDGDYDPEGELPEKVKAGMKSTLKGLGYTEKELAADDFEVEIDELLGRQTIAVVRLKAIPGAKPKEYRSNVSRLKSVEEGATTNDLP